MWAKGSHRQSLPPHMEITDGFLRKCFLGSRRGFTPVEPETLAMVGQLLDNSEILVPLTMSFTEITLFRGLLCYS